MRVVVVAHRAQAVKPDFQLTAANAADVAAICRHLEGLPLAIELAAARCKLLPPTALLQRFTQQIPGRLTLLTGGARDLPARQQTIRATIEWSYSLLDASEQQLFARLGVFAGGFSLEAVEAVCRLPEDAPGDVLAGLQSLLDKSLVRAVGSDTDALRLTMLETLREYVLERLVERGEADAIRARHAAYFLKLVEAVAPRHLASQEESQRFQQIAVEHDNLRAVLHWARERDDVVVGLRVATALWWFWFIRGYYSEGWQWLETFLELSQAYGGTPTAAPDLLRLRAQALNGAGELARQLHDWTNAATYHAEGLRLWRLLDDKHGLAAALRFLGLVAPDLTETRRLIREALVLYQEVGDTYGVAISLMNLGRNTVRDDLVEAAALLEQALTLFRQLGDATGLAWTLFGLGETATCQRNFAQASTCFAESLSLFRELGDRTRMAWALNTLTYARLNAGDVARVEPLLRESLSICRELANSVELGRTVVGWAHLALRQGQITRAARLLGAAERLIEPSGEPSAWLPGIWEHVVESVRAQLDTAAFAAAWAEGRAMAVEQAVAYALEHV